jgi:hypothetical protein
VDAPAKVPMFKDKTGLQLWFAIIRVGNLLPLGASSNPELGQTLVACAVLQYMDQLIWSRGGCRNFQYNSHHVRHSF